MRTLALLVVLAGCQGVEPEPPTSTSTASVIHPVVLIGADGFDCSIAAPMIKEGRLPNITNLISRGVIGTMETITPTKSPIIWTTIATGVRKRKHGIRGFIVKEGRGKAKSKVNAATHDAVDAEQEDSRELVRSTNRKVKALWNIVGEAGRRVATIGWWVTWPVEQVNGVMVAQTNTTLPRSKNNAPGQTVKGTLLADYPAQVWPTDLNGELTATVTEVEATMPKRVDDIFGESFDDTKGALWTRLWKQSEWSMRADAIYHQVALDLLRKAEEPYDLFMVYFGGTDVLGHRFFRWYKPSAYDHPPNDKEVAAFGDVLPKYYEELDRMVGDLVAASPKDANIIIVSDHGMYAWQTHAPFKGNDVDNGRFLSGHHKEGSPACLVAAGPNIDSTTIPKPSTKNAPHMGAVYDITPTILHLLGLPQGKDMPGEANPQIIAPAFMNAHKVTKVPTHTPKGWVPNTVSLETEDDQEERREQLRTLGYIE